MNFVSLVTVDEVQRMLSSPDMWHPLKSGWFMARWGSPLLAKQYEDLAALMNSREICVVANPGVLAARLIQEKFEVKFVSLVLQPGVLPSCSLPPVMPGDLTLPRWAPRSLGEAYWRMVDVAADLLLGRELNRLRTQLGLRPVSRLFQWWLSPEKVFGLFPNWYAPRQDDWPPQLELVGFGKSDGDKTVLPGSVRAFCEAGSPPIAFTLGTGMAHARGFFHSAVEACQRTGRRGVLLTKFADQVPSELPSSVHYCDFAPFHQLLPHCDAIVHHGGVGTTAAALQSGCPQLLLPLAWDQDDNAARVTRLKTGVTLSRRRRTGRSLADAIQQVTDPTIRTRCEQVALMADQADGLEVAANLLMKSVSADRYVGGL